MMKHKLTAALLAAGLLTCSSCFAALEYSYDREAKHFTVKSEEIIPLEEGANQLKVTFSKEYNFDYGKAISTAKPTYYVRLYVEGTKDYRFADNANYWQEHNYTYEQIKELQNIKEQLILLETEKKAEKKSLEEQKKANNNKAPILTSEEQKKKEEVHSARNEKEQALKKREAEIRKDKNKLKRNPSTLIYLTVENKLSKPNLSKPLYDFQPPYSTKEQPKSSNKKPGNKQSNGTVSIPDAALDTAVKNGVVTPKNKNLMDLELAKSKKKRNALKQQAEREKLAKLNVDNPQEAEKLREDILKREAEKKIALAEANEIRIRQEISQHSTQIEEVKATRAAFEKYKQEQKESLGGMVYTSSAWAKLANKDNFLNKIAHSSKNNIPLFFEVKFWSGSANQRLWLKNDKLKELSELIAYDLAKDKANLEFIKK